MAALRNGASANAAANGKSCLRIAGERGHIEVARILLRAGVDPNEVIGRNGNTLLNHAVTSDNFGFASVLLEHRADPSIANRFGKTPLFAACHGENEFLLQRILSKSELTPDAEGNTPLHEAATYGSKGMCEMLIQRGAWVNKRNDRGITPYYIASSMGRQEVMDLLVARGADASIMPYPEPEDTKPRIVQQLLDFEASEQPLPSLLSVRKVAEGENLGRSSKQDGLRI